MFLAGWLLMSMGAHDLTMASQAQSESAGTTFLTFIGLTGLILGVIVVWRS
jgi:uncharacterized membrane protein HdeD (DUF308 family)